MSGARPLRRLVAVIVAGSVATGRTCQRCRVTIDGGPVISMRRPGRSRGVTWCRTCAEPYLEADHAGS